MLCTKSTKDTGDFSSRFIPSQPHTNTFQFLRPLLYSGQICQHSVDITWVCTITLMKLFATSYSLHVSASAGRSILWWRIRKHSNFASQFSTTNFLSCFAPYKNCITKCDAIPVKLFPVNTPFLRVFTPCLSINTLHRCIDLWALFYFAGDFLRLKSLLYYLQNMCYCKNSLKSSLTNDLQNKLIILQL